MLPYLVPSEANDIVETREFLKGESRLITALFQAHIGMNESTSICFEGVEYAKHFPLGYERKKMH